MFPINLPIRTLLFADPPYNIFLFEITSVGRKWGGEKKKKALQEKDVVEVLSLERNVEIRAVTWVGRMDISLAGAECWLPFSIGHPGRSIPL